MKLIHRWAVDSTDLMRLEMVVAAALRASQRVAEKAEAVRSSVQDSDPTSNTFPHCRHLQTVWVGASLTLTT